MSARRAARLRFPSRQRRASRRTAAGSSSRERPRSRCATWASLRYAARSASSASRIGSSSASMPTRAAPEPPAPPTAEPTAHVLRLLDVADAIDLARAADLLRAFAPTLGPAVLRGPEPLPGAGVVLAREPLDVPLGSVSVGGL